MVTTLETLKPKGMNKPVHVTAEYKGLRYLITHAPDWFTAENVALDYVSKFNDGAGFFTGDIYGSQSIDGKAKDFRKAYKGV